MDAKDDRLRQYEMTRRLRMEVERAFGAEIKTPKQFDALRDSIHVHTGVLLSTTTLKRIWGYINESVATRRTTYDVLASYAGWSDADKFENGQEADIESGPLASLHIDVARDLRVGHHVRVMWHPGRMCLLKYRGNLQFEILAVEGSRLCVGDTFTCALIVAGEPLYLDNLVHDNRRVGVYVCGRRNGIKFSIV